MPGVDDLVEIARQFAAALDACDYARAAELLTPGCRYQITADDVRVGPEAILASYHASDEKARRCFDQVRYSSDAETHESGGVWLNFFDELHSGAATHTHSCAQIVYFDEHELIERIDLRLIPGERERLLAFCESQGIKLE